jgi:hypothetical protein
VKSISAGDDNASRLRDDARNLYRGEQKMYERFYGERDPSVRAADTDREAIAERLRHSHAEGRLDVQEFQERLDHCYRAKTIGELEQLVGDLPSPERPPAHWPRWRQLATVRLVPLLIALFLIGAATGHHRHSGLWILIPLFFLARFWRWRRRPQPRR